VLRHDRVWRNKRKMSDRSLRAWRLVAVRQHDVAARGIRAVWRDVGTLFMTSTRMRHPLEKQVNPVRQCARRGAFVLDVAQASPLFSDHAPREVHLWQ
jgi:hypothetical protein